ncbi:dimethyl sulfoxide reductase anchor subunit family protein [Arvimicrobium flavum]|uniref:dimethyl sulfoxide reductase anchor subunit family protein n=1 Tax=Arvimicrobium flavum TaxID=3393320 RepID=UPI00237BB25D|nr:DmsC/YnfH family molybdoenzyme membrane anchor subunit [Mesorhizobium shangrilense]
MHPALSIIVFSTFSGLGYGLAAVLGLGLLDPADVATKVAHFIALALIAGGLLSSTLHLGNPQRAWRAFSQWRSSWLSREGVLAVIAFVPLSWSAIACWFFDLYQPLPGIAGALLAAATVYCTSMIYASLRSVDAWHTRLTPACYLLFAAAGGLTLASAFAFAGVGPAGALSLAALLATLAAWAVKRAWWRRLDTLTPLSTPESATGLGPIGKVRLFERPHINENYLTREMGYRIARKHADKLRRIALGSGAVLPAAVLALLALFGTAGGVISVLAAMLAAFTFLAGVFVERWLFFAQARHAVMNYYGG